MYEGIFEGYCCKVQIKDFSSSFSAAAVDLNQSGLAKKKSLRSGKGETAFSKKQARKHKRHKRGLLLDTVTLNYCAALGLMEVVVLEKPDAWTYQRMKRPAKPDQGAPRVRPKLIDEPGVVDQKTVELFDLSGVGSGGGN
jgi:hypothetical protein